MHWDSRTQPFIASMSTFNLIYYLVMQIPHLHRGMPKVRLQGLGIFIDITCCVCRLAFDVASYECLEDLEKRGRHDVSMGFRLFCVFVHFLLNELVCSLFKYLSKLLVMEG